MSDEDGRAVSQIKEGARDGTRLALLLTLPYLGLATALWLVIEVFGL